MNSYLILLHLSFKRFNVCNRNQHLVLVLGCSFSLWKVNKVFQKCSCLNYFVRLWICFVIMFLSIIRLLIMFFNHFIQRFHWPPSRERHLHYVENDYTVNYILVYLWALKDESSLWAKVTIVAETFSQNRLILLQLQPDYFLSVISLRS